MLTSYADRAIFNGVIARHLNLRLIHISAPGAEAKLPTLQNNDAQSVELECSRDVAVLYYLLMKYVDLLESDQHGGWTQEEDDVVRNVISELLTLGPDSRQI